MLNSSHSGTGSVHRGNNDECTDNQWVTRGNLYLAGVVAVGKLGAVIAGHQMLKVRTIYRWW